MFFECQGKFWEDTRKKQNPFVDRPLNYCQTEQSKNCLQGLSSRKVNKMCRFNKHFFRSGVNFINILHASLFVNILAQKNFKAEHN